MGGGGEHEPAPNHSSEPKKGKPYLLWKKSSLMKEGIKSHQTKPCAEVPKEASLSAQEFPSLNICKHLKEKERVITIQFNQLFLISKAPS